MSKPVSLFRYLAGLGGIRDHHGELAAMNLDRVRVYVRGNGAKGSSVRLVRLDGLPLDRARELAAEAGYMHAYGHRHRAMSETTPADLLDLIRAEHLGDKVYSEFDDIPYASARLPSVESLEHLGDEIDCENAIMESFYDDAPNGPLVTLSGEVIEPLPVELFPMRARDLLDWARETAAKIINRA